MMCDPHLMDILAGNGDGSDDEVAAQHEMLKFNCSMDGSTDELATLTMVRR
jgi:hypothetical protein